MIILISILLFWIVCGYLTYGYTFAYFQLHYSTLAKDEYSSDKRFALFLSIFGPIGLVAASIKGLRRYGRKYR